VRASELLGRRVRDLDGRPLGKVSDLVTQPDANGYPVLVAVLVSKRRRARLLGYERPARQGPWLLRRGAALVFGRAREVPWNQVRWE
jgi:sporulation protein YlmC with PRC-barrel domain